MNVLIDADACPVVNIAVSLCRKNGIPCLLVCDTAHRIEMDGAETLTIDKGADSADFALVNRVAPGDIVITQDYGLASMCLAKGAHVLHQDGWEYTPWNIDALLLQRHESRKYRLSGGRTKGPKKRTSQQDAAFAAAFQKMLQG
ncbi:MAG: YaiI/YqxD family protein [Ruminococcaceae bacterium]|nr:YaiI/YqxD family protein [Oscillospiraceae bacterium]